MLLDFRAGAGPVEQSPQPFPRLGRVARRTPPVLRARDDRDAIGRRAAHGRPVERDAEVVLLSISKLDRGPRVVLGDQPLVARSLCDGPSKEGATGVGLGRRARSASSVAACRRTVSSMRKRVPVGAGKVSSNDLRWSDSTTCNVSLSSRPHTCCGSGQIEAVGKHGESGECQAGGRGQRVGAPAERSG